MGTLPETEDVGLGKPLDEGKADEGGEPAGLGGGVPAGVLGGVTAELGVADVLELAERLELGVPTGESVAAEDGVGDSERVRDAVLVAVFVTDFVGGVV